MACGTAVMQDHVHHLHSMYVIACRIRPGLGMRLQFLMQPQVHDHIHDLYTTWVYCCIDGCKCLVTVLQTRLTALDLIGYAAGDERPRQFVHMPEQELDQELVSIKVHLLTPQLCAVPQGTPSSCV